MTGKWNIVNVRWNFLLPKRLLLLLMDGSDDRFVHFDIDWIWKLALFHFVLVAMLLYVRNHYSSFDVRWARVELRQAPISAEWAVFKMQLIKHEFNEEDINEDASKCRPNHTKWNSNPLDLHPSRRREEEKTNKITNHFRCVWQCKTELLFARTTAAHCRCCNI